MTDVIFFGALPPCDDCEDGKFLYFNHEYKCNGSTQWAKCNKTIKEPARSPAIIPDTLKNNHAIFEQYCGTRTRLVNLDIDTELVCSIFHVLFSKKKLKLCLVTFTFVSIRSSRDLTRIIQKMYSTMSNTTSIN